MTTKKLDADLPDFAMAERTEMMFGVGLGEEAVRRPQIGVASSWGEINPGSTHLDKITQSVKAGIWAAGGTPREFVISSICTSMAGHDNYHLPHRDLVAGYIETVAMTNLFDGMVFVPVCDDVIPGHLMALARLDLPSVVVTGGYMQTNRFRGQAIDPLAVAPKHFTDFKQGKINADEFDRIKDCGCPGGGACPVMGTANTMAGMAEALGLSLPGNMATPGTDSRLNRIAFAAGVRAVQLHQAGIRPSHILNRHSFKNAVRVLHALGGSTNGVLHLQSIANELDLEISIEDFNDASRTTPYLCGIAPGGDGTQLMGDLDEAGGLPALMKELQPLLDSDVMTVTGQSLAENLEPVKHGDRRVIRPLDDPISAEGGLIFLQGSLAPEGALIKKSAVPANMHTHTGPARVFPNEDAACEALIQERIQPGEVVIVRGMGPKGDPGMRLLQRFLWQSAARGMHDKIAFLTDGRFSGTNKGCAVAHISPEAAAGGPFALVRDGDPVTIDITNARLDLQVSQAELDRRQADWVPPKPKGRRGYLSIYSRNAGPTARGAGLDYGPRQPTSETD